MELMRVRVCVIRKNEEEEFGLLCFFLLFPFFFLSWARWLALRQEDRKRETLGEKRRDFDERERRERKALVA